MLRNVVGASLLFLVACGGGDATSPGFTLVSTADGGGSAIDDGTGGAGPSPSTAQGSTGTTGASSGSGDTTRPPFTCSGKEPASGSDLVLTAHDALLRETWVHVPPGYDPDRGTMLVLNFHGFFSDAPQQSLFSKMSAVADERGFLVAYPYGIANSWNAGQCCGTAWADAVDDVDFVDALIDELAERYCVDPHRIYATGMSNGGFMSYRLGCEMADRIAAVAPVAGSLGVPVCLPSRPMPLLAIHGTEDLLVPYQGGMPITEWNTQGNLNFRSVEASTRMFRQINRCSNTTIVTFQHGDVTCRRWQGCDEPVEVCTVEGGGHTWPGGMEVPFLGATTDDLDASRAIIDFFESHPLP